jgi:hypothetical protein
MSDNLSLLQSRRDTLANEHARTLAALCAARATARDASLAAQTTRTPIAQANIDKWQRDIRDYQSRLMSIQGELGQTNKAIRALKARRNSAYRRGVNEKVGPVSLAHDDYLCCFHQIASDSLDPRQFAALEEGAKALVHDFRRMNGDPL